MPFVEYVGVLRWTSVVEPVFEAPQFFVPLAFGAGSGDLKVGDADVF